MQIVWREQFSKTDALIASREIPRSKTTETRLEHPWKANTGKEETERGMKRCVKPEVGASDASEVTTGQTSPEKQTQERTKTLRLKIEP
jgi:hypothetical protein